MGQAQAVGTEKKETLYRGEASFGLRVHTNAVTAFAEKGFIKNIKSKKILQLEFSYFFDPREKRREGQTIGSRTYKGYVYGKQNTFFCFHLNYGYRHTIAEKAKKSGVALYAVYMAGASLGFEKPYYLELIDRSDSSNFSTKPEKYSSDNNDRFLNNTPGKSDIAGYAGMQYGFKDIKLVPGGHIKIGLHFDWAGRDKFIRALEIGASADVYYRKINIMANQTNKPYFLNVYASIQLGKRW